VLKDVSKVIKIFRLFEDGIVSYMLRTMPMKIVGRNKFWFVYNALQQKHKFNKIDGTWQEAVSATRLNLKRRTNFKK